MFFRVQDEHSRAQYLSFEGIYAEDQSSSMTFNIRMHYRNIRDEIEKHLDWANRDPTCLISTYARQDVAEKQARLRIDQGREEVVIFVIDPAQESGGAQYRNLRMLAKKVDFQIPDQASNNSKYEWIFLEQIPDHMIVGTISFELDPTITACSWPWELTCMEITGCRLLYSTTQPENR